MKTSSVRAQATVEVRNYDGDLIRVVPEAVAEQLVEAKLADRLRVYGGFLPRDNRKSCRPDSGPDSA